MITTKLRYALNVVEVAVSHQDNKNLISTVHESHMHGIREIVLSNTHTSCRMKTRLLISLCSIKLLSQYRIPSLICMRRCPKLNKFGYWVLNKTLYGRLPQIHNTHTIEVTVVSVICK